MQEDQSHQAGVPRGVQGRTYASFSRCDSIESSSSWSTILQSSNSLPSPTSSSSSSSRSRPPLPIPKPVIHSDGNDDKYEKDILITQDEILMVEFPAILKPTTLSTQAWPLRWSAGDNFCSPRGFVREDSQWAIDQQDELVQATGKPPALLTYTRDPIHEQTSEGESDSESFQTAKDRYSDVSSDNDDDIVETESIHITIDPDDGDTWIQHATSGHGNHSTASIDLCSRRQMSEKSSAEHRANLTLGLDSSHDVDSPLFSVVKSLGETSSEQEHSMPSIIICSAQTCFGPAARGSSNADEPILATTEATATASVALPLAIEEMVFDQPSPSLTYAVLRIASSLFSRWLPGGNTDTNQQVAVIDADSESGHPGASPPDIESSIQSWFESVAAVAISATSLLASQAAPERTGSIQSPSEAHVVHIGPVTGGTVNTERLAGMVLTTGWATLGFLAHTIAPMTLSLARRGASSTSRLLLFRSRSDEPTEKPADNDGTEGRRGGEEEGGVDLERRERGGSERVFSSDIPARRTVRPADLQKSVDELDVAVDKRLQCSKSKPNLAGIPVQSIHRDDGGGLSPVRSSALSHAALATGRDSRHPRLTDQCMPAALTMTRHIGSNLSVEVSSGESKRNRPRRSSRLSTLQAMPGPENLDPKVRQRLEAQGLAALVWHEGMDDRTNRQWHDPRRRGLPKYIFCNGFRRPRPCATILLTILVVCIVSKFIFTSAS